MSPSDEERRLARFREPAPITLVEALAMSDPVGEISKRLVRRPVRVSRTPHEDLLHKVAAFHDDAGNGGLDQALANSRGAAAGLVAAFVRDEGHAQGVVRPPGDSAIKIAF